MNQIIIKGLSVDAHIGVPDEERAHPQRLLLDVTIEPSINFADLDDQISRTVDYDAASQRITALAAERPRALIETLAHEIADIILKEFPAKSAEVEIRKFILPNTHYVAVRYSQTRPT